MMPLPTIKQRYHTFNPSHCLASYSLREEGAATLQNPHQQLAMTATGKLEPAIMPWRGRIIVITTRSVSIKHNHITSAGLTTDVIKFKNTPSTENKMQRRFSLVTSTPETEFTKTMEHPAAANVELRSHPRPFHRQREVTFYPFEFFLHHFAKSYTIFIAQNRLPNIIIYNIIPNTRKINRLNDRFKYYDISRLLRPF